MNQEEQRMICECGCAMASHFGRSGVGHCRWCEDCEGYHNGHAMYPRWNHQVKEASN